MEIRKKLILADGTDGKERECVFFRIQYNHFRDTGDSIAHECRDREEMAECDCVLCLPESYTESGEETPLILSFHGAFGRVCEADNATGGVYLAEACLDAGYAVLDVCGSELHGITMGCPEHLWAAYKAYRYAVRHFHLSDRVLAAGSSMGGQTALNFTNMFPSIVTAVGIFCPRLNIDGVDVNGHHCIGTWEKVTPVRNMPSSHELLTDIYRFKSSEWSDETIIGFNPYRTRSFINANGERVVIPPCPIKIWQGTADQTVDPVMVEEYVRSVRRSGSYIELHLLDGVGHTVSPIMQQELPMWFNRFI